MEYPIQAAARQTGLSAHVLRIWEKRYGAVVPKRTDTKRRVYTAPEIHRLKLLREATKIGHSISSVAKLATEQLEELVASDRATPAPPTQKANAIDDYRDAPFTRECLEAVRAFDSDRLNNCLHRATVEMGFNGLLRHVIAPLTQELGELWSAGKIKVAHEHFATAAIRSFLLNPARQYAGATSNSTVVVATPQGQLHELGALMAASLASERGWNSIYLGPSLPAAEIAGVAVQNRARAVILGIIYPEDDPNVERELQELRHLLPAGTSILACGRAITSYAKTLEEINAVPVKDLAHLQTELAKMRAHGS